MNPERKEYGVYVNLMLSKKVVLNITEIGKNVKQNLEKKIKYSIEGRCIVEGFVRPKTVEIVSYSSGLIKDDHVEFQVIYRCLICNPIKDMEMDCVVNNVTKAGIHAFVKDDDDNTPVTVFVARDHHVSVPQFDSVQEKDHIRVRIIGTRFELNDPSITTIAALIQERVVRHNYETYKPRDYEGPRDHEGPRDYEEPQENALLQVPNEPRRQEVFDAIEPLPEPVAVAYDEEALANIKKRKIVIKK